MEEERRQSIDNLRNASPLEATKILQEMEMYDKKSSQEIIDEVYEQFASGDNMEEEILKPVFMSVIDGLLEATAAGRAARKKGLTASRVIVECENFTYDGKMFNGTSVNAYTEYKNAKHYEIEYQIDSKNSNAPEYKGAVNSNMSQEYNRAAYEDTKAMKKYKEERVFGEKTLRDEYTGKANLYLEQKNPNEHYNDPKYRKQAQPDHIVPLKQVHEKFKHNYALDDSDIKRISNIADNFAVTSAEINQVKKEMSNSQYIEWMDEHGTPVDEQTKKNMLYLQKKAEKAVDKEANKTVIKNIAGTGDSKEKTHEIRKTATNNAASQATDYAVGNLILFIVKPLYYEISDIFKNGMQESVGAESTIEALSIRFDRVKHHVLIHGKEFLGDNCWEFVKGFVSSLIEGIIGLFVGMFKQVLKIIKEGIKIFTQSAKILFGKDSAEMTPAQKGDAIIKLIGGSVIAIAGIGIETLLNKIGIGEPWSVVLSTMLSGIASALFMYILDKADLFSVKAENRKNRIEEIFNERTNDIKEAMISCNETAIELFKRQREEFENIRTQISADIKGNNIDNINAGLYKMAKFMNVELQYGNTEEFCDFMDSEETILL